MNRRIVILGLLSELVRSNDDYTIEGYIKRGEPVPAGTYHMTRTIDARRGHFISTGSTYYFPRGVPLMALLGARFNLRYNSFLRYGRQSNSPWG